LSRAAEKPKQHTGEFLNDFRHEAMPFEGFQPMEKMLQGHGLEV
jgi:hypothetical protein